MNDMERRKFEDAFKDAFQEAEVNTSSNVWTNIELDLERAEGDKLKRRLLFYKLLAAASVAFAMGVVGLGYYGGLLKDGGPATENQIALDGNAPAALDKNTAETLPSENQTISSAQTSQGSLSSPEVQNVQPGSSPSNGTSISSPSSSSQGQPAPAAGVYSYRNGQGDRVAANRQNSNSTTQLPFDADHNHEAGTRSSAGRSDSFIASSPSASYLSSSSSFNTSSSSSSIGNSGNHANTPSNPATTNTFTAVDAPYHRTLPDLYTAKPIALAFPETEVDPVVRMFAKLDQLERSMAAAGEAEDKKENVEREKLWTAVGFAAGGFNTVNPGLPSGGPSTANTMAASSNGTADKQVKASGVAYSMGISMGTQISKRWVLQGGVNYLTQLSDYTANEVVTSADLQDFKAASLNEFRGADAQRENKVLPTAPYTVNNNVRFISVPMQAGYLIVNKKLGLQLNAGLSTDLFLQNTINPEGGDLDKTSQGRGENSPYRSVNFSGLMGTELSYKFGQRYRIALNPGLRYPLNSIYKSDLGIEATPLTFDVGLRFRYIFR